MLTTIITTKLRFVLLTVVTPVSDIQTTHCSNDVQIKLAKSDVLNIRYQQYQPGHLGRSQWRDLLCVCDEGWDHTDWGEGPEDCRLECWLHPAGHGAWGRATVLLENYVYCKSIYSTTVTVCCHSVLLLLCWIFVVLYYAIYFDGLDICKIKQVLNLDNFYQSAKLLVTPFC